MEQDSGVFIRRIVSDVSDAIIASDPDFGIIEWNPAAENLYGYSEDEARGQKIAELVRREYIGVDREDVVASFNETGHWEGEVYDHTKAGRRILVQTHVSKIHDFNNSFIGVVAVNRDITLQRLQEKRERQNSLIYRLLAVATSECSTREELCNYLVQRLADILEVKAVILSILSDQDPSGCICFSSGTSENLSKALAGDTHIRDRLIKRGQKIQVDDLLETQELAVWVDVLKEYGMRGMLAWPIRVQDQDPIGAIVVLSDQPYGDHNFDPNHLENFSSMTASAVHRVATEEMSRNYAQKLETIFQHIIDVYFRIGPSGILETMSPSGLALFGYDDLSQLVGRSIRDWLFVRPGVYDVFYKEIIDNRSVTNYDFQVKDRDGNVLDLEVNARVAMTDTGEVMYVEGLMRDITRRKQMEEELRIKAKLENMGFLVGSVAHSFNNNLAGVLGSISVSQHYAGDNPKLKNFLAKAEKGCFTAKQTVQQLMLISGSIKPICRPMNLEPVLKSALETVQIACNTVFKLRVKPDLPRIKGNAKQLVQVLTHVLNNSVEAMKSEGQVIIEVGLKTENREVSVAVLKPMITIRIKDTGPGMSPDVIKRVFEPFFTTHATSRGLGLSVSRSIVRRHEGTMFVESKGTGGTTITINLPVYNDDINQISKATNLRILVLDPSDLVRQVFVDLMKELGYEATGVESGPDCLREYRHSLESNDTYGIVFVDVGEVESTTGPAILKMIRRVDPDVRAVATSSFIDHPVIKEYRDYGFNGILIKPFRLKTVEELLDKIHK